MINWEQEEHTCTREEDNKDELLMPFQKTIPNVTDPDTFLFCFVLFGSCCTLFTASFL